MTTPSWSAIGFIVLGLTPEAMGKGNWSVGLSWDDTSGKNAGQYAPFNWRSA